MEVEELRRGKKPPKVSTVGEGAFSEEFLYSHLRLGEGESTTTGDDLQSVAPVVKKVRI